MRYLMSFMCLFLALPVSAQVFTYKDSNGNTVYSDQPPQEGTQAEQVDVKPVVNVPEMTPAAAQEQKQTPSASYEVLKLKVPTEEAIRANNGSFFIDVEMKPPLRWGHKLRLMIDGKPYGQDKVSAHFELTNVDRGDHTGQVQVLSGATVVQNSETVTFTVQRVHTDQEGGDDSGDPNKPGDGDGDGSAYDPPHGGNYKPNVNSPNYKPGATKPNYEPGTNKPSSNKPNYKPSTNKPNYSPKNNAKVGGN